MKLPIPRLTSLPRTHLTIDSSLEMIFFPPPRTTYLSSVPFYHTPSTMTQLTSWVGGATPSPINHQPLHMQAGSPPVGHCPQLHLRLQPHSHRWTRVGLGLEGCGKGQRSPAAGTLITSTHNTPVSKTLLQEASPKPCPTSRH